MLNDLLVNGRCFDSLEDIKIEVINYFHNLFREQWRRRPKLGGSLESQISVESTMELEGVFLEKEI